MHGTKNETKKTFLNIHKYSCVTHDSFPSLLDKHLRTRTRRTSSFSFETWKITHAIVLIFVVCRGVCVGGGGGNVKISRTTFRRHKNDHSATLAASHAVNWISEQELVGRVGWAFKFKVSVSEAVWHLRQTYLNFYDVTISRYISLLFKSELRSWQVCSVPVTVTYSDLCVGADAGWC
jgi:hypothetical protein